MIQKSIMASLSKGYSKLINDKLEDMDFLNKDELKRYIKLRRKTKLKNIFTINVISKVTLLSGKRYKLDERGEDELENLNTRRYELKVRIRELNLDFNTLGNLFRTRNITNIASPSFVTEDGEFMLFIINLSNETFKEYEKLDNKVSMFDDFYKKHEKEYIKLSNESLEYLNDVMEFNLRNKI